MGGDLVMGSGRKLYQTFTVPTSGTFYTKHFSNKVSGLCSIHLYSPDPAVVTDCQYQTSNWTDERELSGAEGNKYWHTEASASLDVLVLNAFTGSVDQSTACHVTNIGTQFFRVKLTVDHSGTFYLNAYAKD